MNQKLIAFKANADTAAMRNETLDGVNYLVVPVVAIVEGVLNGEYVPASEIALKAGKNKVSVDHWNGIPVPVYHPEKNGAWITANSPQVIETQVIGRFYNAIFDTTNNSLKGELWIDTAKADKVNGGADVVKALQNGEIVEVSTSYLSFSQNDSGEFRGKAYTSIASGIRPDHIAVLPGQVGACSVDDGCGAGRSNEADDGKVGRILKIVGNAVRAALTSNELDHGAIRERLGAMIRKGLGSAEYCYIALVYDDRFVYELMPQSGPGRYYERGYSVGTDDQITLGDVITEVQLQTVAVPVQNAGQQGATMQPKTNCTCGAGAPAVPATPAPVATKANTLAELAELAGNDAVKAQVLAIANKDKTDRDAAIKALKDAGSKLSDETIAKMQTNELQALVEQHKQVVDYSGRGGPRQVTTVKNMKAPPAVFGKAPAQEAA